VRICNPFVAAGRAGLVVTPDVCKVVLLRARIVVGLVGLVGTVMRTRKPDGVLFVAGSVFPFPVATFVPVQLPLVVVGI
jgi:hypothetical protein